MGAHSIPSAARWGWLRGQTVGTISWPHPSGEADSILTRGSPTKVPGWHVGSLGLPQAPNKARSPFLPPVTKSKQEAKCSKQKRSSSWKTAPKTPRKWLHGPNSEAPSWHRGAPGHGEPRDGGTKATLAWSFFTSHLGLSSPIQRNTSKRKGRVQEMSGGEGPALKALV